MRTLPYRVTLLKPGIPPFLGFFRTNRTDVPAIRLFGDADLLEVERSRQWAMRSYFNQPNLGEFEVEPSSINCAKFQPFILRPIKNHRSVARLVLEPRFPRALSVFVPLDIPLERFLNPLANILQNGRVDSTKVQQLARPLY